MYIYAYKINIIVPSMYCLTIIQMKVCLPSSAFNKHTNRSHTEMH